MKKIPIIFLFLLVLAFCAYYVGNQSKELISTPEVKLLTKSKKPIDEPALPSLSSIMPNQHELDEVTQKIVGFMPELSYRERNLLVWQLRNRDLTKKDFEACFSFLKRNPEKAGKQLSWHSLKNDLLVILIEDGRYKESMAKLMVDIISDDQQHPIMREYTLQYTTDYFERHWLDIKGVEQEKYSEMDKQIQAEILIAMKQSLTESSQGPVAGTSLIRLHELAENFDFVDHKIVDDGIIRMVQDETVSESSKMAAISLVAERNLPELENNLTDILWDKNSSVLLRMASMNALAKLNPNEEFVNKLNSVFIDQELVDKRLKRSAEMILKKFN